MTWQEYQEAVAVLYEQMDGFGDVQRNIAIPDKVTEEPRQIDVLITLRERGHELRIVVDAKFHATKLDVRDIESTLALSSAVGGSKTVLVAANGWTAPAQRKAEHFNVALSLLTVEEALTLLVPDKWQVCPACEEDCIVLDQGGTTEIKGLIVWWLAGQCRKCHFARVWCQDCGEQYGIRINEIIVCWCGHHWQSKADGIYLRLAESVEADF